MEKTEGATVQQIEGYPKGKNVVSRDPRKAQIVAAYKKALACDKVTELHEPSPGRFVASCMKYDRGIRGYRRLGTFELVGLALAALLALQLTARAAQPTAQLLAVGGDASYHVDTASGAATVATDPAGGEILISLATDPKGGTVYGIDLGAWPTGAMQLVAFDAGGQVAATAEISYLGQPVLLAEGLAFAPSGKLWIGFGYGADFDFYQSGHLGVVDPATGAIDPASVLDMAKVSYPNADADALEFVGGTLYMSDNVFGVGSNLYTINLSTGIATLVGQIKDAGGAFQVTDLAWDGSTLWAETVAGQLLTINRATAAATKAGAAAGLEFDGLTATSACHGKGCK